MKDNDTSPTTGTVAQRYEAYPYPLRDPQDEHRRLLRTEVDDLGALNFYCFRGARDFRSGFRVLVAGGGTGDGVIYLGQQLRETDAEIVYLDISRASMQIAQARAEVRGFRDQITWLEGSLLDLPTMGVGPFDYISCSGVLHHLDDPSAGLKALTSVLAEDGAMGLMVYGQVGRTGVYHMQEMMRIANGEDESIEQRIATTRAVIESTPETNWLKRRWQETPFSFNLDDVELVDMFLHPVDRAYTVPQLYDWLDAESLELVEFTATQRPFYDAGLAIRDATLLSRVHALPRREQRAFGELYFGTIAKHAFWATRQEGATLQLSETDTVPFFPPSALELGIDKALQQAGTQRFTLKIGPEGGAQVGLTLQNEPEAHRFFGLVDGVRSTSEILDAVIGASPGQRSREEVWAVCRDAIEALLRCDLVLMRRRGSVQV